MKFFISSTFKDSLKDESWDDHKKGWSYPWLKTNWVVIKSLETGGATIPIDKYRVDHKAGIIFWLEEGQPRNISLEVESKKSFLGLHRKAILISSLAIAILGLMFWFIQNNPPSSNGGTEKMLVLVDSLKEVNTQKDTSINILNLQKDSLLTTLESLKVGTTAAVFIDSIAGLEKRIAAINREKKTQRNSYRAQLRSKVREIDELNARIATLTAITPPPDPDFPGFTARVMCEQETATTYYSQIATICRNVSITPSNLGVVSTTGKAGTICYSGPNGKKAAEYLKEKLEKLGFLSKVEACSSSGNSKRIIIYID